MLANLKRLKAKTVLVAALAAALVFGAGAGTAYAVVTTPTGGAIDRQYFARDDAPFTVAAAPGVWENVPTMVRTVTVPAGTTRMLDARFTAESSCTGGNWCSVRIVFINGAGTVTEFYPQSGTDYAFDSPSSDAWEGHAIERSTFFVGPGSYRVQVQAAKVGAATFRLDDMHFVVASITP